MQRGESSINESTRTAVHREEDRWRSSAEVVGSGTPIPASFTGRDSSVRKSGGDGSGGDATKEGGEEGVLQCGLDRQEVQRDVVYDSL